MTLGQSPSKGTYTKSQMKWKHTRKKGTLKDVRSRRPLDLPTPPACNELAGWTLDIEVPNLSVGATLKKAVEQRTGFVGTLVVEMEQGNNGD